MTTLGVDIGSHYTKFAVIDDSLSLIHTVLVPTLFRRRDTLNETLNDIRKRFQIDAQCATGYGRDSTDINLKKPELICASIGVSARYPLLKILIDIGGEDIKVIESGPGGNVERFYMNDKCSAGTGAFIAEIAEKAELEIRDMSSLARESMTDRIMNSFCTVFAKTEILSWKFDGVSASDMARGIYLSVVDRVCKIPMRDDLPVFLCGGVAAHHAYLATLLSQRIGSDVQITSDPQFMVAYGAALAARQSAAH